MVQENEVPFRTKKHSLAEGCEKVALLKTDKLTIKFGGLTAVSGLDLVINEGEIVGLIGPNGAGKTTALT